MADVRHAISVGLRILALTIVQFICFAIAGTMVARVGAPPPQDPGAAGNTAALLLLVCFVNSAVLAHLVLRSRWSGWRLMATVAFVYYGVATFMSQIESAVFLTQLPPGLVPVLFCSGLAIAIPVGVLAVLILGKWTARPTDAAQDVRLAMPASEWAWKLAAIVLAYLVLYFSFGYFVAWRNPALRAYYHGTDTGNFVTQMQSTFAATPWLAPFQVLRALLWTLLALPVVRMLKGGWQETSLSLGLLFGVVMPGPLLLPNAFMPETVRMSHLMEIAPSNFLFGCLVGWLLGQRRRGSTPSS
jgi:hypothetical protein